MQTAYRILPPNNWERENTYLNHLAKLQRVYTLPSQVKQTQLQFKNQKVSTEKSRLEHVRFKTAQRKSIQLLENKKMLNAMLRISSRENQTLFKVTNSERIRNHKDKLSQVKNAISATGDQDEGKEYKNSSDEKDLGMDKQDSLERETYQRKNQEEDEQENSSPCQDNNIYPHKQSQTYQALPMTKQSFQQLSQKIYHKTSSNNRSFNSKNIPPSTANNYNSQSPKQSRIKTDNHTQSSLIEKENFNLALRMIHTGSTYSKVAQDEDYRIHQDRLNRLRKFKKSQQFNTTFQNISQPYSSFLRNSADLKQPSRQHSETTEGSKSKRNQGLGFKESPSRKINKLPRYPLGIERQSENDLNRKAKITTSATQKRNDRGNHNAAISSSNGGGVVDSTIVSLQFASLDIPAGVSGQCSLIIGAAAGDDDQEQEHTSQSRLKHKIIHNNTKNSNNLNNNLNDSPHNIFLAESNIFDFSSIPVLAFSFPLPRFLLHRDLTCTVVSHSEHRKQVIGGFYIPPISLSQEEQLQSASVVCQQCDIGTAVFFIKQEVSAKSENDIKVSSKENNYSCNQQNYLPRLLPKYSKSRSFTLGNNSTTSNTYCTEASQFGDVTSCLTLPSNNMVSPQFSQQSSRSIQPQKRQLFGSLARYNSHAQ